MSIRIRAFSILRTVRRVNIPRPVSFKAPLVMFVSLLVIFMCSLSIVFSNEFKSVPTTVKTYENDTVLLPCYLDNLGTEETGGLPESIRWFKDGDLIADSANDSVVANRVRLWDNGSLEVGHIEDSDTGEYMCEVMRKQPWSSIRQLHAIEVLYPPSVESNPVSGKLQVKLGEEVQMSCSASGVPYPLMTWTSKGNLMHLLDNRQTLRFKAKDRFLSGTYECIATNGVGSPARATIQLNIIYVPEVIVGKEWVHTAPGLRAVLDCIVSADPPAEVEWFKSNISVPLDSRVVTLVDGDKHSLLIRSAQISDFGIYTCRATNELGVAEANIQLSGVANPGVFKEVEQKDSDKIKNSFTLVWEVDSYTPIIEYNLWFRPFRVYNIIRKPDWTKLTIPAEHTSGPLHSKAYSIIGLKENTVYEAMLFSRNRYGWSKPSTIFRFSIDGTELKDEVVTQIHIQENIIPVEIIPVQMSMSGGRTVHNLRYVVYFIGLMYLLKLR